MKPTSVPLMCIALATLCFATDTGPTANDSRLALLSPKRAKISNNPGSNWTVTPTPVGASEDLIDFHKLNVNVGKALGAKGSIFETVDGGRSWQRSGGLPAADFARIWFVNRTLGWATVIRQIRPGKRKDFNAVVMRTEDGGRNWAVQHTVKNGSLNNLTFANEQEGWAVGSTRHIAHEQRTEKILVLHTVDGGQNWRDLSQSFAQELDDLAEDIFSEPIGKATILTSNGKIFTTENGGNSWSSLKAPERERPQLANLRVLKDPAHRLWVLSSTNSRELVTTRLAQLDSNGLWSITTLPDLYISDVRFLSANQMIACGSAGQEKSQRLVENQEGIVVFSSDGGKTWQTIYRTPKTPAFNVLAVFDRDRVLALGDNGLAFSLHRPSAQ